MSESKPKKLATKATGIVGPGAVLDYFLTDLEVAGSPHESFRARLLVFCYLFSGPVCLIIAFLAPIDLPVQILTSIIGLTGLTHIVLLKLNKVSVDVSAVTGCSVIIASLGAVAFFTGTVFSGEFIWFPVICIALIFFNGIKIGTIFAVSLVLILSGSHYLYGDFGLKPMSGLSEQETYLVNMFCQFLSVVFAVGLAIVFEVERKNGIEMLKLSQEKVLGQQKKISENARVAELGEMSAEISHEIKNPLTVIKSSVELIARIDKNDPKFEFKMQRLTSKVDETCNRIDDIIRGLQSMARDGAGDPFVEVEISSVFKELEVIFRKRARMEGVDFSLHAGENTHLVYGRKSQVYQVTFNLIKNAFDALSEQGIDSKKISITTQSADKMIIVKVADNGKGIPIEHEAQVFEAFFTTKEDGAGSGLGLSIAKKIISEHGGDLFIDRGSLMSSVCYTLQKYSSVIEREKLETDTPEQQKSAS